MRKDIKLTNWGIKELENKINSEGNQYLECINWLPGVNLVTPKWQWMLEDGEIKKFESLIKDHPWYSKLKNRDCIVCHELFPKAKANYDCIYRVYKTKQIIERIKEVLNYNYNRKGKMKIERLDINRLTEDDIGRWVAWVDRDYNIVVGFDVGKIKAYNKQMDSWKFVVYKCNNKWNRVLNYTGKSSMPPPVMFIKNLKKDASYEDAVRKINIELQDSN